MDFEQAQAEFQKLKEQYSSGQISAQDFEEGVNLLVVIRPDGSRWRMGPLTGRWYREREGHWTRATPGGLSERIGETFPPGSPQRLLATGIISVVCIFLIYATVAAAALLERPVVSLIALPFRRTLPGGVALYRSPTATSATPTLILTDTPQPPSTSTPTPTVTATVTVTAAPAAIAQDPQGPWLAIQGKDHLWLVSATGKAVDEIPGESGPVKMAIAPKGGQIAWITVRDPQNRRGITLNIARLPDLAKLQKIPLSTPKTEPADGAGPGNLAWEAARAIVEQPSLAWSPDGNQLAFVGMQDGPTADLYLYNSADSSIVRLDDHPGNAYAPSWSPDNRFIVFFGAYQFDSVTGFSMAGAWWVDTGSQIVRDLLTPSSHGESVTGWVFPRTVMVASEDPVCKSSDLRTINPETKQIRSIFKGCFQQAAMDPQTGTAVIAVGQKVPSACTCSRDPLTPGTYIIPMGLGLPRPLSGSSTVEAAWMEAAHLFFTGPDHGWTAAYTSTGDAVKLPVTQLLPDGQLGSLPVVSTAGSTWAWKDDRGAWVRGSGGSPVQIYQGNVTAVLWSQDSQALFVFSGDQVLKGDSPGFQTTPVQTLNDTIVQAGWIWP